MLPKICSIKMIAEPSWSEISCACCDHVCTVCCTQIFFDFVF